MKKLAYLECPTGISGDMCLGALVDAGMPLDYLQEKLAGLGIADEYQLRSQTVQRNGQQATKIQVDLASSSNASPQTDPFHLQDPLHPHHHDLLHPHSHARDRAAEGNPASSQHSHHSHNRSQAQPAAETSAQPAAETSAQPAAETFAQLAHAPARHLADIEGLITVAGLPERVQCWSLAVFRQLAVAEGAVHGVAPETVQFHEVGATDAIIDIVGTCLGLDWLGIEQLFCSALPTGGGTVHAAHGLLPVPAPAVLKLWQLRQVPVYSNGMERELVTPTGAAIATTLATEFGPPPSLTLQRIGLGAGNRNLALPNILRLWLGEGQGSAKTIVPFQSHKWTQSKQEEPPQPQAQPVAPPIQETITLLETQVDDLNPQAIGYLFETLFAAGALDVFTQAIGMKKSRPGILLTVLCAPDCASACEAILFRETTTLGIRRSNQQRTILNRTIQSIQTRYGPVRIKTAWADTPAQSTSSRIDPTNGNLNNGHLNNKPDRIRNVQPEYEDCAQLARQYNLPWREVHQLALQAWYKQQRKEQSFH